jgi:apolipoprotein N-acyltransferase
VDPYGRVLVRTELFVPTVVTADVSLISARTIYSRLGDVVVWASFGVTLATIALGWRRMR